MDERCVLGTLKCPSSFTLKIVAGRKQLLVYDTAMLRQTVRRLKHLPNALADQQTCRRPEVISHVFVFALGHSCTGRLRGIDSHPSASQSVS